MKKNNIIIDGVKLFYRDFIPEKINSTFVILHGWGGESASWIKVGKILKSKGFRVLVPDLPGFGDTELSKIYRLDDYANLIEKFCQELKLKDIILLGHSNGGAISIKLCNNSKIKIKRLILNNSAGIRNDKKRKFKKKVLGIIVNIVNPIFKKLKLQSNKYYKYLRINFYKLIGSSDYINSEKSKYFNETYKNMIASDLTEELAQINLNTDLIWGSKDTYTPISDAYIFEKHIKKSKLNILKNERHSIHIFNPEALAKEILNNL